MNKVQISNLNALFSKFHQIAFNQKLKKEMSICPKVTGIHFLQLEKGQDLTEITRFQEPGCPSCTDRAGNRSTPRTQTRTPSGTRLACILEFLVNQLYNC